MVYDMALSAADFDRLLEAGLIPVSKVALTSQGKVATQNLGMHTFNAKDGSAHERIVTAVHGTPCITIIDGNGTDFYVPLKLLQVKKTSRKTRPQINTFWVIPADELVPPPLRRRQEPHPPPTHQERTRRRAQPLTGTAHLPRVRPPLCRPHRPAPRLRVRQQRPQVPAVEPPLPRPATQQSRLHQDRIPNPRPGYCASGTPPTHRRGHDPLVRQAPHRRGGHTPPTSGLTGSKPTPSRNQRAPAPHRRAPARPTAPKPAKRHAASLQIPRSRPHSAFRAVIRVPPALVAYVRDHKHQGQSLALRQGWNGSGLILERLPGVGARNPRSEAVRDAGLHLIVAM